MNQLLRFLLLFSIFFLSRNFSFGETQVSTVFVIKKCVIQDSNFIKKINLLHEKNEVARYEIFMAIGEYWNRCGFFKNAEKAYLNAKSNAFSRTNNSDVQYANYCLLSVDTKITKYQEYNQLLNAYYFEKLRFSESARNIGFLSLRISNYFYGKSDFKNSLKWSIIGLKHFHSKSEYQDLQSELLNQSAISLIQVANYRRAKIFLLKAKSIDDKYKDPITNNNIILNLGIIEMFTNNFRQAELKFNECLNNAKLRSDYENASIIYFNLSELETKKGNLNRAIQQMDSVVYFARKDNNNSNLLSGLYFKGVLENEFGETNKLIRTLSSLDSLLKIFPDVEYQAYFYELKSKYFFSIGKFSEAYNSLSRFTVMIDSLRGKSKELEVSEMLAIHNEELLNSEVKLKQKEILLNKQKHRAENERIEKWLFIVLTFSLLMILVFTLYFSRNKRIQRTIFVQKLIEGLDNERKRFSKELHDNIGHMLILLKYSIKKNSNSSDNIIELQHEVDGILNETRKLSFELYPEKIIRHGLKLAVDDIIKKIVSQGSLHISFRHYGDIESLSHDQKLNLFRIVQELSQNTLKHSRANSAEIELKCIDNVFLLKYSDNGIGLDLKQKSNVFKIDNYFSSLKERVRLLNGTIKFRNLKPTGLEFIITFELLKT